MFEFFQKLLELWDAHPAWSVITFLSVSIIPFIFKYTINIHISEFAKEHRKSKKDNRSKRKLIAYAKKQSANQDGKMFSFGRFSTNIYALDFCLQGYSEEFLITNLQDSPFTPPSPSIADVYKDKLEHWMKKRENGDIFEGAPKVALKKISLDRSPLKEEKRIRIQISESAGYVHQRAATSVFQGLDESIKKQYIDEPAHTMEPFFSNSFGMLLGIITGDNQLVFVERGKKTAVNHSRIICGAVEGMVMDDITNGNLDPIKAAKRALSEEFGINLSHAECSAIKITACIFNCDYHEWNLVGYVDLRNFGKKYISSVLCDYKTIAKAHDSWEGKELIFIEFDPKKIAGYLTSHEDMVTNYSLVTAIYTLLCACKETKEIEKVFGTNIDLTQ